MAGTQTAGFDLVMQFSEEAYRDILGVFFDTTNGLISRIIDLIPGVDADEFVLSVGLDRPTDVALEPPNAENPMDIRLGIGMQGNLATVRIVVGVIVDRSQPDRDVVIIDFANSIYYAGVTVLGDPIPIPNLRERLQNLIPSVPMLPAPVDRTSTVPTTITRLDFRIIDDTSEADRDATAGMLTFGGGSTGNASNLSSFVPAGGRGAIAIYFPWLCRMAVPRLESALGLPSGSFTITPNQCSLNRTVRVDDDEEVDLTALTISLDDGFINISAHVTTDGFCYDASGDVSARLLLQIRDGRLQVEVEIGDPDVDVDIPWYCWLAAAALGALIGGILVGVIGGIVGAVLVPLIVWLASEVIEGTIDRVADEIVDAINQAIPELDVPAFGVRIIFQDVFIDDVVLQIVLKVEDYHPVRAQGVVTLHTGEGLDLDSGEVGGAGFAHADVRWEGRLFGRYLKTGCQAALARTGLYDFANLLHYKLYSYSYQTNTSVSLSELGWNPFAGLFGIEEPQKVYAFRTNDGNYSFVQVIDVDLGQIRLRYRTFETEQVSVQIQGDFLCTRPVEIPKDAVIRFVPEATATVPVMPLEYIQTVTYPQEMTTSSREPIDPRGSMLYSGRTAAAMRIRAARGRAVPPDPSVPSEEAAESHESYEIHVQNPHVLALPLFHYGKWYGEFEVAQNAYARLHAVASGVKGTPKFVWTVGGQGLQDGTSGKIDVFGTEVDYTVNGAELLLSVDAKAEVEMFVKVVVVDAKGCSASSGRCVKYDGKCPVKKQYIANWKEFRELQALPNSIVETGFVTIADLKVPVIVPPSESILLTPPSLDFGMEDTEKVFAITNPGGSDMGWRIVSKQPNWIINVDPKGEPLAPGASSNVSVEVYRRGLNAGQYQHEISIRYNDQNGNILTVPFMITMGIPD